MRIKRHFNPRKYSSFNNKGVVERRQNQDETKSLHNEEKSRKVMKKL